MFSNILYHSSVWFVPTFDYFWEHVPTKLLISSFFASSLDFIKLSVVNSKTRILLTEILINLELLNVDLSFIYTCMFYVSVNSNVIPPNFRAFHIPLIFALYQLKISEISTLLVVCITRTNFFYFAYIFTKNEITYSLI